MTYFKIASYRNNYTFIKSHLILKLIAYLDGFYLIIYESAKSLAL